MRFKIEDLPVLFPYPKIYPEQHAYMCDLKKTLDVGGKGLLEMPSGTGKTVSLLYLIVAYQMHYPARRKLIYCSRTMSEIEKVLVELKALMNYRAKELGYDEEFRGLEPHNLLPNGVWTLDNLLCYGEQRKQCPYFTSRRMMEFCNVIIYSHHYLLDPKIAERISNELSNDCIVVFDEAHNIDNVCIESLSTDITEDSLNRAARGVISIEQQVNEMKETDRDKLRNEYRKLVEGLRDGDGTCQEDIFMPNPVLPDDLLKEAMPGNIRRSEHFLVFLKRFIEYLKTRLKVRQVVSETPSSFLAHLKEHSFIERKPLQFCVERLASLVRTLQITNIEDIKSLQEVAVFATLLATYEKGFLLIFEPFNSRTIETPDPILHFACLDAAIAIRPIFERFHSVIITSGTLSPLEMYPKMLNFTTVLQKTYAMTLARKSLLPVIITRGSDQASLSTSVQVRNEPSVARNYGNLLIEFSKLTPDGMVVFFPSYLYMESIISVWQGMGILDEIWKYKLILVETPDAHETSLALERYRTACSNGRGAVMLCVARGKVSEGIDFNHQYGRAVICIGVPFQHTESLILRAPLEFLRDTYNIRENDFLSFDAMRHAAQCLGRVLRGKGDYGIMVLADQRFQKKTAQLPRWINESLLDVDTNLSTDMAVSYAKQFLKRMAQPFRAKDQEGVSIWGPDDLQKHQEKAAEETNTTLQGAQKSINMQGIVSVVCSRTGKDSESDMDDDEVG